MRCTTLDAATSDEVAASCVSGVEDAEDVDERWSEDTMQKASDDEWPSA
jgi:hypothetical protein